MPCNSIFNYLDVLVLPMYVIRPPFVSQVRNHRLECHFSGGARWRQKVRLIVHANMSSLVTIVNMRSTSNRDMEDREFVVPEGSRGSSVNITSCVCSRTYLSLWVCLYTNSKILQRDMYEKSQKHPYFLNISRLYISTSI
jgi:hypothetical protein